MLASGQTLEGEGWSPQPCAFGSESQLAGATPITGFGRLLREH